MKIKWLGHSSFLLTESTGITVQTDPFDPEMVGYGYDPQNVDIVTMSHGHADHNFIKGVAGHKKLFDAPGNYEYEGIHILGVPSFHDDKDGQVRGNNVLFIAD